MADQAPASEIPPAELPTVELDGVAAPTTAHDEETVADTRVEEPVGDPWADLDRPGEHAVAAGSAPIDRRAMWRASEIARGRAMARAGIVMVTLTAALLWHLGGDSIAKRFMWGGLAAFFVAVVAILVVTRSPARYTAGARIVTFALATSGILATLPFFGIFSAAAIVPLLGLYHHGYIQDRPVAWCNYAVAAVGYASLVGLDLAGVFDGPGLIGPADFGVRDKLIAGTLIEAFWLSAFLVARASRRAAMGAFEALDRAEREVSQRDAWLDEAHRDVELQLGSPGGLSGARFGDYRLGDVIGRGAMGEVYEAAHVRTGEPAAIKVLSARAMDKPGGIERFVREARAAAALDSPHVVAVRESSVVAEDGRIPAVPYLVMERLRGVDLSRHLRTRGKLEPAEVIDLVQQIGRGLQAAADAGIVHRDIKPQNIFRVDGPRPVWKILDFGASKLADTSGTLTRDNLIGTPQYMAPEQVRGGAVDPRADLYALGALVYRCLVGRPPFLGELGAILYQVAHETAPPPSSLGRLPPALDDFMAVALAKRPEDRFATAADFEAALRAALASRATR